MRMRARMRARSGVGSGRPACPAGQKSLPNEVLSHFRYKIAGHESAQCPPFKYVAFGITLSNDPRLNMRYCSCQPDGILALTAPSKKKTEISKNPKMKSAKSKKIIVHLTPDFEG